MSELVEAARVNSTVEAQLIVGLLQSNDIEALVSADDVGGQDPQFQLTDGVRVLVRSDRLTEAHALIAEAQDTR